MPDRRELIREFKTGDVLIREGDKSAGFYILIDGRLGVYKSNVKVAEIVENGVVFGELAMILNKPRTATVTALEPSKAMYVSADVDELMISYPKVAASLIFNLAERLYNTTENYITSVRNLEEKFDKIGGGSK
ncbi:MAG: Crp/Fnr family transcriptional regulator [Syntrophothermus sp.]